MIDTTEARPFNQGWPVKIKVTAKLIALSPAWKSGRDIWRPLLAWQCRRESLCGRRAKVFYTGRRPATVQCVALEWSLDFGRQGNPSKESLDIPVVVPATADVADMAAKVQDRLLLPAQRQTSPVIFSLRRDFLAQLATRREKGEEKTRKNSLIAIAVLLNSVTPRLRLRKRPTN